MTGLARAGKTLFLTSLAANLLAFGTGRPVLPALQRALGSRRLGVCLAPAGAAGVPRFDYAAHLQRLAADPPHWPARTDAVSLLALDLVLPRLGVTGLLPPQRIRLELLDYPGEWLLDLPLLRQDFAQWSDATLRRLESAPEARGFLAFATGLPAQASADEALATSGHRLYVAALHAIRDASGLSLLQPGRFLMPAPGAPPPYMAFFPMRGAGGLAGLMADRYGRYVRQVADDLVSPLFGRLDRLVMLTDLLGALHAGPAAFADARDAVGLVAGSLRWSRSWREWVGALATLHLPPPSVQRVALAATKADHVGERQRTNLATLLRALVPGEVRVSTVASFAVASLRCTEEATMVLDGRAVSAVQGRLPGQGLVRSYPGEVPAEPPDERFWQHEFYSLPAFEPTRLPGDGRYGVPQIGLDSLLAFLLADVL